MEDTTNFIRVERATGIADRTPLPDFLRGLLPESLVDLTWADPDLGVGPYAWLPPVEGRSEHYDPSTHTTTREGETLVADLVAGVVRITPGVRPLTADELAASAAARKARADEAWGRIKQARETRISTSGVLVDGHWYHSDVPFKEVINQSLRLYSVNALADEDPVKMAVAGKLAALRDAAWKTMANVWVPASYILGVKIDAAHAVLAAACHARAEALRQSVYAAGDPYAVDITTGWPQTFHEAQAETNGW